MKKSLSMYFAAALLLAAFVNTTARAYEKGGIAFILDHGKELNLNDEQKRKLNSMRTQEERTRLKILTEPDMKTAIHKILEAKRKSDEAATQEAVAELIKKLIDKAAPVAKTMIEDLTKILTPDQIDKINELKAAEEQKSKPGNPKPDERNRPKRGTPPPNPFSF